MSVKTEVIFTPALLPYYNCKGKTVVIIDILRATTSICVAFAHGVKRILPVSTPEEAALFRDFDFIIAAERNAIKVDGFDLGNSPFEYENSILEGKSIAFTTTNGTKAIKMAREQGAERILIGSFLNIDALCKTLTKQPTSDILLVCAGWKDKFNLEDTVFAGAVIDKIKSYVDANSDSCIAALGLFKQAEDNLYEYINKTAHAERFRILQGNSDDIAYCTRMNTINLVPELTGEYLTAGNLPAVNAN